MFPRSFLLDSDMSQPVHVPTRMTQIAADFSPEVIGEVNDVFVKLARINAQDIPWHEHSGEDELFYVLAGEMEFEQSEAEGCTKFMNEVLQHKRETQPVRVPSAGCIFRNPPGQDDQGRPLSAGRLIDEAGLKGLRIGGAMVSPIHANYIVNVAHASGRDFLALIEVVRQRVEGHSGIRLENEVEVWS